MLKQIALRVERMVYSRRSYKFFIKDWIALGDLQTCATVVGTMRFTRNLEPLPLDRPHHNRITVIAPHPDDEMLGPGGTLIRAIGAGARVHCIYMTSSKPVDVVEAETEAIARKVGYTTEFLRFPLGAIPADDKSVEALAEAIRRNGPRCLFLPFLFDDHDDHRRVSHLLLAICERNLLPGGTEVWAYQVYTALLANVVVDITDVAEKKAEAIRGWRSQMRYRDWAHYMLGLNAFNSRFLRTGGRAAYVESFFVIPLDEYAELCRIYFTDPSGVYYSKAYRNGL